MSFLYASVLWLLIPLFIYAYRSKKRVSLAQNLRWIVLGLLLIALARPVISQNVEMQKIEAHSLIFALDLSVSMKAKDIKPSRAMASRAVIKSFLKLDRQEQIALVGFTINPLLLSPPTTDHRLVSLALDNMNTEYILTKGTDLKKLFEKIAAFKDKSKKVILLSDGGDEVLDESLMQLVEEKNIEVFVIAMATEQGASVTNKDGTLLQDAKGHIVVSKLNRGLKILAQRSGGEFLAFSSVEHTVDGIVNWLEDETVLNEALERESKTYFELAFVPVFLALILFFISATRFSKNFLALLLFLGMNVHAQELISREHWGEGTNALKVKSTEWKVLDAYYLHKAYTNYENKEYEKSKKSLYQIKNRKLEAELLLAHIFYKQEKYKQARSVFQGIKSSDKKVKQQLLYELGNCEAKLSYMQKAKNYYVKALQLGMDEDTLHNLKIVMLSVKEDSSKVGYTNPSSAEATKSKSKNETLELEEKKSSSQKNESKGTTGGSGAKQSKNSTVKVVKSEEESASKRTLSSKAYDLINEGYINENKPW